jgi:hypothetical protein
MLPLMAEQLTSPISSQDLLRLQGSVLEQWQYIPLEHQVVFAPILLKQLVESEHGSQLLAALQTLQKEPMAQAPTEAKQEKRSNTWFEWYFEERLARLEFDLQPWALRAFHLEDKLTHDEMMQAVRIALWRRFSENPEEWANLPPGKWLAYAKETYRWQVVGFHRDGQRKLGLVASDMEAIANDQDITDDEALTMLDIGRVQGGHFAYPREILLAELRIDLQRALERGINRLCESQQRDMPLLIADLLDGYTLDETCERHQWTRNRGVTLMRKLRTVFYQEMTGEKKTGYLGSHHPLTETEKQRIRDLYATGLSYKKVAALVGRSASAVEAICKPYPLEIVEQVRALRNQGLSLSEISKRVGRGKSYVGGILTHALWEGPDDPHKRDGKNIFPVQTSEEVMVDSEDSQEA